MKRVKVSTFLLLLHSIRTYQLQWDTGKGGVASTWLLLTWLWRDDPKQDACQEKAEATQDRRLLHCCAWQVSPFKFTCPAKYPSFTARKDESLRVFDGSSDCEFVSTLWLLLHKFTVCPTVLCVVSFVPSGLICHWRKNRNCGKSASNSRTENQKLAKKMRKALYSYHYSPS